MLTIYWKKLKYRKARKICGPIGSKTASLRLNLSLFFWTKQESSFEPSKQEGFEHHIFCWVLLDLSMISLKC